MSPKSQDGFALIAVMGLVALVTVVAIGGYVLSEQVLSESTRVQGESRAFQVAQSGLDRELAGFSEANLLDGAFERTGSTSDGTYTVVISGIAGSEFEYIMTSTGTSEGEVESVSMRFFYLDLWNMNIGAGDEASLGGGSGWNGNAAIKGPLYIRGDLDWHANAVFEGGPLFIRDGVLDADASSTLGKAVPIKLFATGGYTDTTLLNKQLYLDSLSYSVPDIELPWVDDEYLDEMLQLALGESVDNYMGTPDRGLESSEAVSGNPTTYVPTRVVSVPASTSDYYKYIGPATGRSGSNEGSTFVEIDGTSFGAWDGNGYPVGSERHDDFAYDFGTGTLYVEGTVFIDGDLHIGPNVSNYVGNGTLVVNGDVYIGTDLRPRDGLDASEVMGIVSPGNVFIGANIFENAIGHFTGAVFSNGVVNLSRPGTSFEGSILGGQIAGDSPNIAITTNPILPGVLPSSMPGAGGGIVFPGTWTRN